MYINLFGAKFGIQNRDMFDEARTDFSAMVGNAKEPPRVGRVVHKLFIDVSEEGTAAGAQTVVVHSFRSIPLKPPTPFVRDRPFVFAVRDNLNRTVPFTVRVVDPTRG